MLAYLIRQSRLVLLTASAANVISGICGVLMITKINTALTSEEHSAALIWSFRTHRGSGTGLCFPHCLKT